MPAKSHIIVQARQDTAWKTVLRYDGEDPAKARAEAKTAVAEGQVDEVRILVGRYDATKQKHAYQQLYTSGPIKRSAAVPAPKIAVQVRSGATWKTALQYDGDDQEKARAIADQVVAEGQSDEVRILLGRYDAAKQKHTYQQIFSSGPIDRQPSPQPRPVTPTADRNRDQATAPPIEATNSTAPSAAAMPHEAGSNFRDASRAALGSMVDKLTPLKGAGGSRPSRKKLIGIGIAASVAVIAMGGAAYAWKLGVFEDPKVTGYGVLTVHVQNAGPGVCVEDGGAKDILAGLNGTGKITSVQASAVRGSAGLDDAFIKLKTKGCGAFFGSAASIAKLSEGLTRDRRKFSTGDWVGRHQVTVALAPQQIRGEKNNVRELRDNATLLFDRGDYNAAVQAWSLLANQGDAYSQYRLGTMYFAGLVVQQSFSEAMNWFRKAAEQGNAAAQLDLGFGYEQGKGLPQNYTEALNWYRKAADQGHAGGQSSLGNMYQYGRGVQQDDAEAVKWYRKAAEQGDASGQWKLGVAFESGRGVPQDYAEAVKWYRKAAEQGDESGQGLLAKSYVFGKGVAKNLEEGAKWYRLSADKGNNISKRELALMYFDGLGVQKNIVTAFTLMRSAADGGYDEAQISLAYFYLLGVDGGADYAEAARWYRKAAEQGHAGAQQVLGEMYARGLGVPVSEAEAVRWTRMAAAQGNKIAVEAIRRMDK